MAFTLEGYKTIITPYYAYRHVNTLSSTPVAEASNLPTYPNLSFTLANSGAASIYYTGPSTAVSGVYTFLMGYPDYNVLYDPYNPPVVNAWKTTYNYQSSGLIFGERTAAGTSYAPVVYDDGGGIFGWGGAVTDTKIVIGLGAPSGDLRDFMYPIDFKIVFPGTTNLGRVRKVAVEAGIAAVGALRLTGYNRYGEEVVSAINISEYFVDGASGRSIMEIQHPEICSCRVASVSGDLNISESFLLNTIYLPEIQSLESTIFLDGVDYYTSNTINDKWTGGIKRTNNSASQYFLVVPGSGTRTGGNVISAPRTNFITGAHCINERLVKNLDNLYQSLTCGCSFKVEKNRAFGFWQPLIGFSYEGFLVSALGILGDGSIGIGFSSTFVDNWSSPEFVYRSTELKRLKLMGARNYFECSVILHPTSGALHVKVNGKTVFNEVGIKTGQNYYGGTYYSGAECDQVFLCCDGTNNNYSSVDGFYYDDIYIRTGYQNFLGDNQILSLSVSGNGFFNNWTPSGATSNYQCVNEFPHTGDTTFVSLATTGTTGSMDLYRMTSLPSTGISSVNTVQTINYLRKDYAGARKVRSILRSTNLTVADIIESDNISLNSDYVSYIKVFDYEPLLGSSWSKAYIDRIQSGVKVEE